MTITPRKQQCYGWKPSHPDFSIARFQFPRGIAIPRHVDLHQGCPPIWNQSQLGSCTAHGTLAAYWYDRKAQGEHEFMPSRLFQYWMTRAIEGTTSSDSGASISDAVLATQQSGACPENLWPYDIVRFAFTPSPEAVSEALKHRTISQQAIGQDLYSLKYSLASGRPFVFGFVVYQNFEDDVVARTGLVPMPRGNPIGGHCMLGVGFNSHNLIMCRNSWGTGWGDPDFPGYCWMPPEYVTNNNLAADFRIITSVTD